MNELQREKLRARHELDQIEARLHDHWKQEACEEAIFQGLVGGAACAFAIHGEWLTPSLLAGVMVTSLLLLARHACRIHRSVGRWPWRL